MSNSQDKVIPMFHNPYNFVPAPPRSDDPGDGELGNRPPVRARPVS